MKKIPILGRLIKTFASIKFGVVIILAIGGLTAWGTIVEAIYNDAVAAQKLVYNSVWMYAALIFLAICLIAVMIDRWPWQKRHTGFILAHIGILTLLVGAWITRKYGVDGMMQLETNGESGYVMTNETSLTVYASLDGTRWQRVFEKPVDFFLQRPSPEHPVEIPVGNSERAKIVEYLPYAFRDEKIVASQREMAGSAVRFQLQNPMANVTEWLVQPSPGREVSRGFGPAQIVLGKSAPRQFEGRNAIVLTPKLGTEDLDYEVFTARDAKNVKRGVIRAGESFETGWMGLVFRLIKYFPRGEEQISYKATEQATPATSAAIRLVYGGRELWLGQGTNVKLFSDQAVYVVAFETSRIQLGFNIRLKDFRVGRYPGTVRAASYESLVDVPGRGEVTISMNEPMKQSGYTFYQSSFQEDEQGRPIASILSVNRDPGRWIKYLGSLLIVFGTIHLFYFKQRSQRVAKETAEAA